MPTTVVKTIGTAARQYSTWQAWEDATPVSLIAVDQIWRGECYNDSEFAAGVVFSGTTADATRYSILTTAAGQSFRDHANKLTNPLAYDQTKGVGISATDLGHVVHMFEDFVIMENVQIKQPPFGYRQYPVLIDTGGVNTLNIVRNCIIEGDNNNAVFRAASSGSVIENCLVVNKSTVASTGMILGSGAAAYNCTVVHTSNVAGSIGISTSYSNSIAANCAVFGFATAFSASGFDTTNSKNNATDGASAPGTSNQLSLVYANQFVNTTNTGTDFRAKSGNGLQFGVTDTTHTAGIDVIGQTRAATPTIGAWEYIVSAASIAGAAQAVATATGALQGSAALSGTAQAIATAAGTVQASAALSGAAAGMATAYGDIRIGSTITTKILANNTTTIYANVSGCTLLIYHPTTHVLLNVISGLTTNSAGIISTFVSGLVPGNYPYDVILPDGSRRLRPAVAA